MYDVQIEVVEHVDLSSQKTADDNCCKIPIRRDREIKKELDKWNVENTGGRLIGIPGGTEKDEEAR